MSLYSMFVTFAAFVWDGQPILFSIPAIDLPFSVSWFALLGGFFGAQWLHSRWQKKGVSPIPFGFWGIFVALFVGIQLLDLIIQGPGFSTLGPIEPRWYGLMFALAFISGYGLASRELTYIGLSPQELDRLLMVVLIATVVGARLGHIIFYDLDFYLANPELIPQIWRGGLASHGAAIAIPLAVWFYARSLKKITFLQLADRIAIGVSIAGMFIRTGNFFNSEILGQPTDLPWAIVFAQRDLLPRHPTMLYEALWCLVVLAILLFLLHRYAKKPPRGLLLGTFLSVMFTGRFMLEFTKMRQAAFATDWPLSMGQLLSIPAVLIGLWLVYKALTSKSKA